MFETIQFPARLELQGSAIGRRCSYPSGWLALTTGTVESPSGSCRGLSNLTRNPLDFLVAASLLLSYEAPKDRDYTVASLMTRLIYAPPAGQRGVCWKGE
jgi:hypothetical protein